MRISILHEGEVMIHAATLSVGQVVDTIYPPDNKREWIEQVLRLKDGTHRQFRLVELTPAAAITVALFWKEAKFARVVKSPGLRRPRSPQVDKLVTDQKG